MIPERPLYEIIRQINRFPELEGCMVGFSGQGQSRIIQQPYCKSPYSSRVVIVIEESPNDDMHLNVELQRWAGTPGGSTERASKPTIVTNRSRLGPELIGAGLSCGLTVVAALGVTAGVAAEVPTGGASSFLVVASWTGLSMGGLQCANGLVRVGAIAVNPLGNSLQQWDSTTWYATTTLVVDAIAVAGALGSLPFAIRNLWAVIARQRAFITQRLSFEALKAMNRTQRMQAISSCFEEAGRTLPGREALVKAAREAKIAAETLQRTSGISVKHAASLQRIISVETVKRLSAGIKEVLSGVVGVGVSGTPASWTGSGSGSVNWVFNLIDTGAPS